MHTSSTCISHPTCSAGAAGRSQMLPEICGDAVEALLAPVMCWLLLLLLLLLQPRPAAVHLAPAPQQLPTFPAAGRAKARNEVKQTCSVRPRTLCM